MGYKFVQMKGTRAGLGFNVKKGKSGRSVRVYENGQTALQGKPSPPVTGVKQQPIIKTASLPRKAHIAQQIANAKDPAFTRPTKSSNFKRGVTFGYDGNVPQQAGQTNPKQKQPTPDLAKVREMLLKQKVSQFAARKKRQGAPRY